MAKAKVQTEIDPQIVKLFPSGLSKGDRKKAEIVQAIVEIVADEGFEALSFDRIGQKVGIAKSHVAYHFHSKGDMIHMGYQYILNHGQNFVIQEIINAAPGLDRFIAYLRSHYLKWMKLKPAQARFLVMIYGRCGYDEELREFNNTVRLAGRNRIREMIKEDPLIPEAAYEIASRFLHDVVTGALVDLVCLHGNASESERRQKTDGTIASVETYWKSLRKK